MLDESPTNRAATVSTPAIVQTGNPPRFVAALDAFVRWFSGHWLAVIVGILLLYALLPFGAPVLMKAGLNGAAQYIYQPYKLVCHTYAFRSFFLFGQQVVYPRGNGDGEFERATGIQDDPIGMFQARDFQGNEQVGYKVALCQRDIAIYLSMAVNGIAFAFVRRRARPLPWLWFILLGILPIGLDGFSQVFSQWPLNLIPFRESTWYLRVITGSLFGFSVAWLVFPLIEETMQSVKSKA
ncbi:MAG: DUF2085 domain-containing protein [Chloroflexi bacterium]|nr:DUF2085 domain-containing protein [Chloroflexota bacterium]